MLVCMPAAAVPDSLKMKGRRGREGEQVREIEMPIGWNEKAEGKKITIGKRQKKRSVDVFVGSILFHYLRPLFCTPPCLCGRAGFETLWPGTDLKTPQMFRSEVFFRAKWGNLSGCPISYWTLDYWNNITSTHRAAAQRSSLHFQTMICHSNPKTPATVKQQGGCFLISHHCSSFIHFSRFSLVSGGKFLQCLVIISCCLRVLLTGKIIDKKRILPFHSQKTFKFDTQFVPWVFSLFFLFAVPLKTIRRLCPFKSQQVDNLSQK